MARPTVRIGGAAAGSIQGVQALLERMAELPAGLIADIHADLNAGADDLVGRIQAIAPVSDLEAHPGELRESVHREDGRTSLSVLVVEDAKDVKGHGYAPHVEFGHKTVDGGHVPALPHFWPSVRLAKKDIRARLSRSLSKRVRAAAGS